MPVPNHVADLIYQHPQTHGEIYQCGAMEIPSMAKTINTRGFIDCSLVAEGLRDYGFSMIAFTAGRFQPEVEKAGRNIEVIHAPFADSDGLSPSEIAEVAQLVLQGADCIEKKDCSRN